MMIVKCINAFSLLHDQSEVRQDIKVGGIYLADEACDDRNCYLINVNGNWYELYKERFVPACSLAAALYQIETR